MRILVLSDIHGNKFGLEAVLADVQGEYDALLSLGDIVGYGAHPNECCALLREAGAVSLSGNHDAAALGLIDITWFNPVAKQALLWTREALGADNKAWLGTLSGRQDFPNWGFEAVHGSLREPWEEYILDGDTATATIELMQRPLCFFGHTHVACLFRAAAAPGRATNLEIGSLTEGGDFDYGPEFRHLVNPGSCGQPRDGNPQARYAVVDTQTREINVVAIDYEWHAARQAILDAGLPRMLGDRLLSGR